MANDLDLDELHDAVNALMEQSKSKKTAPSTENTPVPVTTEPAQAVEVNKQKVVAQTADSNKIEVRRPLPNLAVGRPRGRAMDVIGPKQSPPVMPPSSRGGREAPTIQPSQEVKAEAPKAEPAEPSPVHETPELKPEAPKHEWPDPLELQSTDVNSQVSATANEKSQADQQSYGTSPFLNTKVEKRPLGAYAVEKSEPEVEQNNQTAPDLAEMPDQALSTPQQPSELSPEVVAVESAETEHLAAPESNNEIQDARQSAIHQQYQTKPKDVDVGSHPVFDTKDYHPPIESHTHPKNGSALGWVMVIVFALVLIGALLFAFYMMTGGLDFSVLFS